MAGVGLEMVMATRSQFEEAFLPLLVRGYRTTWPSIILVLSCIEARKAMERRLDCLGHCVVLLMIMRFSERLWQSQFV